MTWYTFLFAVGAFIVGYVLAVAMSIPTFNQQAEQIAQLGADIANLKAVNEQHRAAMTSRAEALRRSAGGEGTWVN